MDPLGDLVDSLKQNPIPGLFFSSSTDNSVICCSQAMLSVSTCFFFRNRGSKRSPNLFFSPLFFLT
jgi:hypothetical protein